MRRTQPVVVLVSQQTERCSVWSFCYSIELITPDVGRELLVIMASVHTEDLGTQRPELFRSSPGLIRTLKASNTCWPLILRDLQPGIPYLRPHLSNHQPTIAIRASTAGRSS